MPAKGKHCFFLEATINGNKDNLPPPLAQGDPGKRNISHHNWQRQHNGLLRWFPLWSRDWSLSEAVTVVQPPMALSAASTHTMVHGATTHPPLLPLTLIVNIRGCQPQSLNMEQTFNRLSSMNFITIWVLNSHKCLLVCWFFSIPDVFGPIVAERKNKKYSQQTTWVVTYLSQPV